jgi:hypothetical protein
MSSRTKAPLNRKMKKHRTEKIPLRESKLLTLEFINNAGRELKDIRSRDTRTKAISSRLRR